MSNDNSTSSYSADFRNIFGSDVHSKDEKEQDISADGRRDGNKMNSDAQQSAISLPPSSLLSTDALTFNHDNQRDNDNNITPSILLEQLAYVDNFMPSLEQDFANLDSWVMGGNEFGSTNTENLLSGQGIQYHNVMGVDERLALELNAFADDSFIFPDEDKSQTMGHDKENNSGDDKGGTDGFDANNNSNNDNSNNSNNNSNNTRSHFLTQRRNNFLTSQYDHSKSRFSARKRRKTNQNNEDEMVSNHSASPNQDHGGFSNFDVVSNGGDANNIMNSFYTPSVSSPLTNLRASQSLSAANSDTISPSVNSVSNADVTPQIQMPDYSTIPTATLVSLLPRVKVPPNAYQSLLDQGLDIDQINAIAVIIAYHQQEKMKENRNTNVQGRENSSNSNDASRSASFLLDVLARGNSSRNLINNAQVKKDDELRRQSLADNEFMTAGSPKKNRDDIQKIERKSSEAVIKKENALKALDLKEANSTERLSPTAKKDNTTDSTPRLHTRKSHQKRKLKENELEASVHELSELAISLQQKIHTLEMENSVLKNLVTSSGELEGIEKEENKTNDISSKNEPASKGKFNDK